MKFKTRPNASIFVDQIFFLSIRLRKYFFFVKICGKKKRFTEASFCWDEFGNSSANCNGKCRTIGSGGSWHPCQTIVCFVVNNTNLVLSSAPKASSQCLGPLH